MERLGILRLLGTLEILKNLRQMGRLKRLERNGRGVGREGRPRRKKMVRIMDKWLQREKVTEAKVEGQRKEIQQMMAKMKRGEASGICRMREKIQKM